MLLAHPVKLDNCDNRVALDWWSGGLKNAGSPLIFRPVDVKGTGVRPGDRSRRGVMQEIAYLALARAIELVGRRGVCEVLRVSETSIDLWTLKKAAIPGRVFSALTDLLIALDLDHQRSNPAHQSGGPSVLLKAVDPAADL